MSPSTEDSPEFKGFCGTYSICGFHHVAEKGDRKTVLSHSPHPRLASYIDSLSYLIKALPFEPRKLIPRCVTQHKITESVMNLTI